MLPPQWNVCDMQDFINTDLDEEEEEEDLEESVFCVVCVRSPGKNG